MILLAEEGRRSGGPGLPGIPDLQMTAGHFHHIDNVAAFNFLSFEGMKESDKGVT